MTSFLLVISLLLNGISIYFIFILYSRQNRLLEVEKTQESLKKEIENEISAFLFEMKEENEEFIKRFEQLKKAGHTNQSSPADPFKLTETNDASTSNGNDYVDESDTKTWEATATKVFKKQAVKVYQKTITDREENLASVPDNEKHNEGKSEPPQITNEEIYRDVLINQVQILQNQGLSNDEIAKKLNKGKTEIELLLKFS